MIAFAVIMIVSGVVMSTVPWTQGIGLFALAWGLFLLVLGFFAKAPQSAETHEVRPAGSRTLEPPAAQQVGQPVAKEVYRERETIIREIVKIRCRNCGTLFEEKMDRCPHCGAPL